MNTVFAGSTGLIGAIVLVLLVGAGVGFAFLGGAPSNKLLTDNLAEPLNGATTAKVDISSDTGHLTIDGLQSDKQMLASGTLEYFEKQGEPSRVLASNNGQATLSVKGGGTPKFSLRFPWAACGGAYLWQIHLNPAVPSDITAHSGGGNMKLDLAGMAVTRLWAETLGGNMDLVLPDGVANLNVTARTGGGNVNVEMGNGFTGSNTLDVNSGAGNVVVRVPGGVAARIHAGSGMGKVTVDSRFEKLDANTFQSPDYNSAADKVELTLKSGAGNVSVTAE